MRLVVFFVTVHSKTENQPSAVAGDSLLCGFVMVSVPRLPAWAYFLGSHPIKLVKQVVSIHGILQVLTPASKVQSDRDNSLKSRVFAVVRDFWR